MNKVTISGKIISKSRQQISKGDRKYTNISIAIKSAGSVDHVRSLHIKCIAFNSLSDVLEKYTYLEDMIAISGHLDVNLSGDIIIVIENISLLPNNRSENRLKYDRNDYNDDYIKGIDLIKEITESENFI